MRWAPEDVVLLTTKGQDTLAALLALRAAAGDQVPVVCAQNGVENERLAQRFFQHVYGAVVMAPTTHLEPGIVEAHGSVLSGMIDLGRFPAPERITLSGAPSRRPLMRAQFLFRAVPDIMRLKYAKLLLNLGNAVQALCGSGKDAQELTTRAVAEGRQVLDAAGIEHRDDGVGDITGRWADRRLGDRRAPARWGIELAEPAAGGRRDRDRLPQRRDPAAGSHARNPNADQRRALPVRGARGAGGRSAGFGIAAGDPGGGPSERIRPERPQRRSAAPSSPLFGPQAA